MRVDEWKRGVCGWSYIEVSTEHQPLIGRHFPPAISTDVVRLWILFVEDISELEAVRDATWKLRIAPAAADWRSQDLLPSDAPVIVQLFNMRDDPYEHFNRADTHPEIVDRLRREMMSFANETGASLAFSP